MGKLKTATGLTALTAAAGLGLLGIILGVALLSAAPALLGGFVGWFLWNHGLQELCHGPRLGYWACVGILWALAMVVQVFRALLK